MDKQKSHAFDKDVYLLGKDKAGDYLWLEAASFNCGWYWGFGYVETYTRQLDPYNSKDIRMHQHFNGLIWKKDENNDYLHHINKILAESTMTDEESWKLSDLMKSFYSLEETAEILGLGGSHLTSSAVSETLKRPEMVKVINEKLLPSLFKNVYEILTPKEDTL